ncbi:MAG: transcriptional repressor LexA [Anaerolineae bacterium]|nr:transcriptional repressor LexA [Anaerolineae bacterium]
MTMALSERQNKILEFLKSFTLDNGYPPTIREIGKAVGITSTSVVNYNLDALQRAGFIYRDRTVSRGIRLAEGLEELVSSVELVRIPMLGRIAAGIPIQVPEGAFDRETDVIELTPDLLPPQREGIYALKVQGTSMIDALINDGDIVVMRHTNTAENGDMVAAWLLDREETTLKRFFHEGNRVRLQPENQTMAPIFVDPDKVEVQGRVVTVIRQLN